MIPTLKSIASIYQVPVILGPLVSRALSKRSCFTALFLILFMLMPATMRADTASFPEPLTVTARVMDRQGMALALDAQGRSFLLWQHLSPDGEQIELMQTVLPNLRPQSIATIQASEDFLGVASNHPGYAMAEADPFIVAYNDVVSDTQVITVTQPEMMQETAWELARQSPLWTFDVDAKANIYVAWMENDLLQAYHSAQEMTISLALDPSLTVERLQIDADAHRHSYVAWSTWDEGSGAGSVWYAPLITDTVPIEVFPDGSLADMAVDDDGMLHLTWFAPEGLYYANNRARESRTLVAPGLSSGTPVALAVGPEGIAHLAWAHNGTLFHSVSHDWELLRTHLATVGDVTFLDMAIDALHNPRLAWIETPDAEGTQLRFLAPSSSDLQIQVTWPLDGIVVTGDTWVQVAANRQAADWQRIEFYVQSRLSNKEAPGPIQELGIDRDGSDGWRALLRPQNLDLRAEHRIIALGVDTANRVARAQSGWFHVTAQDEAWLWPQPALTDAASGEITLALHVPSDQEPLVRMDVYLASAHTRALEMGDPPPGDVPPLFYAGSLDVAGLPDSPVVYLDTRQIPDGSYTLRAVGYDAAGEAVQARMAHQIVIDNTLAPLISEVTVQKSAVISPTIEIVAHADAPHRYPERVNFYLQRADGVLFEGGAPPVADLLWVGHDLDGQDGWRVEVPVGAQWSDQSWYAWAVACDARDFCTTSRSSSPVSLWNEDIPDLWLSYPEEKSVLRGGAMIQLEVDAVPEQVARAEAFIAYPDGALLPLGELTMTDGLWVLDWDTLVHPDGVYDLLVEVTFETEQRKPVWSRQVAIVNQQPAWRFAAPAAGQAMRGFMTISLAPDEAGVPIQSVTFYARDVSGQLFPIGAGRPDGDRWSVLWNSSRLLDGEYTLVAVLDTKGGERFYLEQAVQVHNAMPDLSLLKGPGAEGIPVVGPERTIWYARHPMGRPLSMTVEYSPDGGGHWLPLARDVSAHDSLTWDSTTVPDSDTAFMRLTVTDGHYYQQLTDGPFVVGNRNGPPAVTLIQPQPGDILGHEAVITWQSADAGGGAVSVDLYYRHNEEPWRLLVRGLPDTGRYLWESSGLDPGGGYDVRAVARNAQRISQAAIADDLTLVDSGLPEVNLVWPNDDVHLYSEVAILWQTANPDGDELLIDLYYSDNGGLTWFPLAESLPDDSYYMWQVSFLPPGDAYRLRIVARNDYARVQDESSGLITVSEAPMPHVRLLCPEAGHTLSAVWPVSWSVTGVSEQNISYDLVGRINGSDTWEPLAERIGNRGYYLWDTRDGADGLYELAVRARQNGEESLSNIVGPLVVQNAGERPLQVQLMAPSGGEMWSGLREIRWRATGAERRDLVTVIELSDDAGRTWQPLAELTGATQRYLWDTREWPAEQRYMIRVTVTEGERQSMAQSAGTLSLGNRGNYPPQLTITSPDAEGTLIGDSVVTWIAEDMDSDPLSLSIALSDDDGRTWQPIATDLLNTGEYVLQEPLVTDKSYTLRLIADDGLYRMHARSAPFTLSSPERLRPNVRLTGPEPGTVWSDAVPILWDAADLAGRTLMIDIDYSVDGGQTWTSLAQNLDNTGSYEWDTRSMVNGTYRLRLVADNGRIQQMQIGEPFVLMSDRGDRPSISFADAGIEATWSGTREVIWRELDDAPERVGVHLDYSLGPHGPWMGLAYGLPNTGRAVWDSTAALNSEDLWLRLTATDGRWESVVYSDGPLAVRNFAAPSVRLLLPQDGEIWTGVHQISWRAVLNGDLVDVSLQHSLDGGRVWHEIARGLPAYGSHRWDTITVPDGSSVLVRILATGETTQGAAILQEPILVRGNSSRDMLSFPFW